MTLVVLNLAEVELNNSLGSPSSGTFPWNFWMLDSSERPVALASLMPLRHPRQKTTEVVVSATVAVVGHAADGTSKF